MVSVFWKALKEKQKQEYEMDTAGGCAGADSCGHRYKAQYARRHFAGCAKPGCSGDTDRNRSGK